MLAALAVLAVTTAAPARAAQPAPAAAHQPQEIDRIVAVVNDDVIVESELEAQVRTVLAQLRRSGTAAPPAKVLRRQVLERLILDRLQLQLAQKNGMRVDDDTLNRTLTHLAAQNKLTLRQFRDLLERDGYDFTKFREQIRKELLITEVRKRFVEDRVQVSRRDVDNYLATVKKQGGSNSEYHIAQILVAVPEGASAEQIDAARKRIDTIRGKLAAGADFGELAVANSDGQQALSGGDLGWRHAQDLPTIFSTVVPHLAPGKVSDPIRSASGFHLVKLLEVRGSAGRHVITQTHAEHILIKTSELVDDATARRRLSDLETRIKNGENFAELARSHSEDPGSAAKGGDLGWLSPGDVVPEFQDVMDRLKPGQVSDPFKTRFGWHIVKVIARRDYDDTEQVRRSEARRKLRQRKIEEAMQNWLRQLRDEAYVEYRLDE